mmetsp:Transcript_15619/g.38974  ORF Transcript_15619/g.38974 Transcript_15619/m.38974 type:complete len:1775 (-) Transcript_15619:91-5415(-)
MTPTTTTTTRIAPVSLSLSLLSLLLLLVDNNNNGLVRFVDAGGIQSGSSPGSFYAGGLYLDVDNNAVYMTGLQYNSDLASTVGRLQGTTLSGESNCFVGQVDLASKDEDFDSFTSLTPFGADGGLTTCTSATLHSPAQLIVVGSAETEGIDRPIGPSDPGQSTFVMPLSGFLLAYDKTNLVLTDGTSLTHESDPTNKLLYPVSTVSDNSNNVYVVALTSTDSTEMEDGSDRPDWQERNKYGRSFDMTVLKVSIEQPTTNGIPDGPVEIVDSWTSEFPVDPDPVDPSVPPRVYIGGMIYKKDASTNTERVIVAGSTRGFGDAYGLAVDNDEDGFVTVLDPKNGQLHTGVTSSKREGSDKDDIVLGICHDPNDPDAFYIVGATEGNLDGIQGTSSTLRQNLPDGSLQPFIRKMSTSTLRPVWTVQWAALPPDGQTSKAFGYATDCSVDLTDGGVSVYVGGTVQNGARMTEGDEVLKNQGGDDIWSAKLSSDDGSVLWMTQLGSTGNDKLAPYGGMAVNPNDDQVLLYGTTDGNMYRDRSSDTNSDVSDVFIMNIQKNDGALFTSDVSFLGFGSSANSNSDPNIPSPTNAPDTSPTGPTGPAPTPSPVTGPTTPVVEDDGHEFTAIGVQLVGPMYAGGIVYDDTQDSIFFTGMAFGNTISGSCVVGLVNLETGDLNHAEYFGVNGKQDACSSIAFSSIDDIVYAVGNIEGGSGQFAESTWPTDSTAVQPGAIFQTNDQTDLLGGTKFSGGATAISPVAIAVHPSDPAVFVVSMATDEENVNDMSNPEYPNLTSGGDKQFGENFYLQVSRWTVDEVPKTVHNGDPPETLSTSWNEQYKVDSGSLIVSGMTLVSGGMMIVVGSTRGSGGPFLTNSGTDMDGFVLKLDTDTGGLATDGTSSSRVDSSNSQDDWVLNVCDDRFDNDAFYIVGTSMGTVRGLEEDQQPPQGSLHGFVAKIKTDTLQEEWLKHFTMTSPTGGIVEGEALACAVTLESEGSNIVYVAGTVQNGAVMNGASEITESYGKDDIWVASMDGKSGDLNWMTQVGTRENDRLASEGGLTVDKFGNAVVLGETHGSLFAQNDDPDGAPNVVVFTINKKLGDNLGPKTDGEGVGDGGDGGEIDNPAPIQVLPESVAGIQTGPDVGPSYAGGMVYDQLSDAVYITGSTYGSFAGPGVTPQSNSQCFLGIAKLPRLDWVGRSVVGTAAAPEACSALTRPSSDDATFETILAGSTERNGLMTDFGSPSTDVEQYGMLVDIDGPDVVGGTIMDDNRVQVPIQVISGSNNDVYVVSMQSSDARVNPDFRRVARREYPNYTSGGVEKYGSQYSIVVEKQTVTRSGDVSANGGVLQQTLSLEWRKPFQTTDATSIYVSGMSFIESRSALITVGSTRGAEGGNDMDGIMAKMNANTGDFFAESSGSRSVAYFASESGKDDWIMNVCTGDDSDSFFYVVGATRGALGDGFSKDQSDGVIHPVVAKISVENLDIVWSRQFAITGGGQATDQIAGSTGLGCALVPRKTFMYVAGNVESGAVIQSPTGEPQFTAGGEDIFVARINTDNGDVNWVKQIGSRGDDRVAHGGAVVVDNNGNAVVFGDTTGDFYRKRGGDPNPSYSDLFMMVVDQQNGAHIRPLTSASAPRRRSSSTGSNIYIAIGVVLALCFALFVFFWCMSQRQKRKQAEAQKSSIFAYLQQFDVEDIDLRKSPPGGWHGTYLNKLAYGINKADVNGTQNEGDGLIQVETAPLTHSSIVSDSLFMDTGVSPSLGGGGNGYSNGDDLQQRKEKEII